MKMNKKGFTLIEMLVVIAIIAVLVAIIIPTVSNSTEKAAAAANAANLRSVYAELQTDVLAGVEDDKGYVTITVADDGTITADLSEDAPKAAKIGNDVGKDAEMEIAQDDETDEWVVTYASKTIEDFATYAETGAWPAAEG